MLHAPDSTASEAPARFNGPLPADRLYRPADLSRMSFTTTAELEPVDELAGQARAGDAIRFGTRIAKSGFNLFVIGPAGAAMQAAVRTVLSRQAQQEQAPSDWVYVNNFADADRPIAIALPAGRAPAFRSAMRDLIDDLKTALPAVFQSEDYQTRRTAIDEAFQRKQGEAFAALRDKAAAKGVAILRTPFGFALAPVQDGKVVPPDEFGAWPEAKRKEVQEAIESLEKELEHVVRQIPQWDKQRREDTRSLNRQTAKFAVDQQIDEAKVHFVDLARIIEHIEAVRMDLVENIAGLIAGSEAGEAEPADPKAGNPFDRYEVNVLVTQADHGKGAPVIEELHPTLANLIGRIEYLSLRGILATNFRLIKAGAMHRANGGYLLVDARSLLTEPFSWTALKRTLRSGAITIEDVSRFLGLASTLSLEPDPVPLDVKVVLFGDRVLYFLLAALDPDIGEHFKVLADFENDIERTPDTEAVLARLVAAMVREAGLRPFDRPAVALVLEHAARLADHAGKLTLLTDRIREVLTEADFWAAEAGHAVVVREDLQRALDEKIRRVSRLRDRARQAILENVALIDTAGARIGQINGLSVAEIGGYAFGRPSRITCQVRPGSGKVVDIEREVELGGPIHSKGVLILTGFLAGRYALDTPMSLFASLVFEQSYGGIEGDSASSAELYALMSALAGTPLRQDLAVTGSVNQHGEIQAIGGVNEKIEGFFDICNARGLTGTQGVLIPQANVQHLMLRPDVVAACAEGRFFVYPVAGIDEGIELLTGSPAGARAADGAYTPDTINRRIEERLRAFAKVRAQHARQAQDAIANDRT